MAIMIPVYVVNALYLWPITLWTYLNYGRPPKAKRDTNMPSHCAHHPPHAGGDGETENAHSTVGGGSSDSGTQHDGHHSNRTQNGAISHDTMDGDGDHGRQASTKDDGDAGHDMNTHAHHHHGGSERPMFATVTIAVCHCGAGCVIGDIIGEWLVYGAGATISGRALWPAYLIDFAFAIALGIFFQYFSIAPMAGEYGPKTLWRAAKADFLSLLFFEIGLFGWMAIFQIAIFHWKLEVDSVTYWWMMQIGMFCGHWTGVPINWWLIKTGVKEPCA
ncbi:hypothetical protein B0A55_12476 [Friedmanniomyces simplex]|uniref:DUF4396 domain-containing protein n=1 Tax=Friedmanniomyces simplex TaxID=329884 RepID=A0A4U0W9D5_9PEZI|nr:hypothetical protein B0A55_12476 [Friedmanniomyces simplex]